MIPDFSPFRLMGPDDRPIAPRPMLSRDGIGDRLRAAAFAEIQAREAFLWAARTFDDATPELKETWLRLANEEEKHLNWLLTRMNDLGMNPSDIPVSDLLWHSFMKCTSAEQFSIYMATAEERGRRAGERFREGLEKIDPETARIFGQIALEEIGHIKTAERFFPEAFATDFIQKTKPKGQKT